MITDIRVVMLYVKFSNRGLNSLKFIRLIFYFIIINFIFTSFLFIASKQVRFLFFINIFTKIPAYDPSDHHIQQINFLRFLYQEVLLPQFVFQVLHQIPMKKHRILLMSVVLNCL